MDPAGRWQAAVDMTWRFDGFDEVPVHEEVLVGFEIEQSDDGPASPSFGGGDRRSPVWLSGPLEVRRSADVAGAGRTTAGRGGPGRRPGRGAPSPSCATCCRSGREAGGGGAGLRGGPGRGAGRRPGHLRQHRGRLGVGRRHDHARLRGARLREPGRLRRPRAGRRPGRDQPRGDPRGHRRAAHQRGAAVAARGVRRLRRAARRRPADHDHGRPDHPAGPARRRPGPPARPGRVRREPTAPRGGVRERLDRLPGARRRGRPGRAGAALRGRVARSGARRAARASCSASPRPS